MRVKDHYDWIAIGETPGSLLSAALAAKAGFSVLVIPSSVGMDSKVVEVSQGEQVLDPEPNAWIGAVESEKQKGLLRELFVKLGALPAELDAFESLARGQDIVTPDLRIKIGAGYKALLADLQRESKQLGAISPLRSQPLLSALRLSEDSILSHWSRSSSRLSVRKGASSKAHVDPSLSSFLKEISKSSGGQSAEARPWFDLRPRADQEISDPNVMRAARYLWTGSTDGRGVPLHWLQLCALSRTTGAYRGGATAFREYLLKLARRLGADIAPSPEFKRLWIRRGRFQGVQLGAKSSILSARGAAVGVGLHDLRRRTYYSGWANYARLRSPLKPVGWRFTLALTVHAEALPPGVGPRVVFQEAGAPPLEVEIGFPTHYGVNDPEYRCLQIRTVLPYQSETLGQEYLRTMAGRMIRRLTDVFPFVEYHVVHLYPDFRATAAQREKLKLFSSTHPEEKRDSVSTDRKKTDLEEVYGFESVEDIPANLLVFPEQGLGIRSGVGHLFLTNAEAYPELGSLGPIWAALESVAWLSHKSGISGPT